MANQYEVHGDDGSIFDVTTEEHHDNHTDDSFKTHLGRIVDGVISSAAGGVAGFLITRYIFKGRR